ncbi:calponin homology domain-containing protein [Zopfochytrium polystomum]|nr:calponin homology domain-containing protein [Zopfochytrium polystomum]
MTESKTELLTWLNDLLQLKYSRVDQCGTGAAYCQIMDSIYGKCDVPISKVKFASKTEYDYFNNFKILQSVFNNHQIDKAIPMDKLAQCRYNDNLEFLQWIKKYWDAFYPGGGYDATARRNGKAKPASPSHAFPAHGHHHTADDARATPGRTAPREHFSAAEKDHQAKEMSKQIADLKAAGDTLEKERNFYYLKLRDY